MSPCSIHNAVIAVFQKKGLADNELYVLNEGVRYVSAFSAFWPACLTACPICADQTFPSQPLVLCTLCPARRPGESCDWARYLIIFPSQTPTPITSPAQPSNLVFMHRGGSCASFHTQPNSRPVVLSPACDGPVIYQSNVSSGIS